MHRRPLIAIFWLACAGLISAAGCTAHNEDDRIQGKMFYRAGPTPKPEGNTMTVGRYGHNADYGRWGERGQVNSDAWTETSSTVGRYGTTVQTSTWAATGVGGEPIDNGGISSSYFDKGGSTQGVSGEGASSSEYGEGSARYGHDAP